jgi:hypothetical protein
MWRQNDFVLRSFLPAYDAQKSEIVSDDKSTFFMPA